jgi:hypothetical protein
MTAKPIAAVTVSDSVIKIITAIPSTAASTGIFTSVTFIQCEGVCRFSVLSKIVAAALGKNHSSHHQHDYSRNNGNLHSFLHFPLL